MKKFPIITAFITLVMVINCILSSNMMVYADNLVYVHKDYNELNNSITLYVNDISNKPTDITATVGGSNYEVNYFDLNTNSLQNDVYFLISISNFDNTADTKKEKIINDQISGLINYLIVNKSQNSNYYFLFGILSNRELNIPFNDALEGVKWVKLSCALNMCLQDILKSIQYNTTPSKIVIISDGTNEANPSVTHKDVIETLTDIPCEIIPITVEPLLEKDTSIQNINDYNLTGSKSFNLSSNRNDILKQINDLSNIGIFEVNLKELSLNDTKTLELSYINSDTQEKVSIKYDLNELSSNKDDTESSNKNINKKSIIIILLSTLLLIIIIFIVWISVQNKSRK